MTYRQLQQLINDPTTDQNFVGEVWDIVLGLEDVELDNELTSADASSVRQMAMSYRVTLPKSAADLESEAKAKVAEEKAKAEAEAKAKAEADRYNDGIEAVKSDPELWEIYNNHPQIKQKIENSCHCCGAGIINSKDYFIGLSKK